MLFEDLINISLCDIASVFREGLLEVFLGNLSAVIDVELVKYCLQSLFAEVLTHIDSCCNELTVVYSFVLSEVQFFDDVFDLFCTHIHIRLPNHLFQFRYFDETTMISIDLLKLLLELRYLICFKMLNQYVDRCSFQH